MNQSSLSDVFRFRPGILASFTLPVSLFFLRISLTLLWVQPTWAAISHYVWPSSDNASTFPRSSKLILLFRPIIPYLPICDSPTTLSCMLYAINIFFLAYLYRYAIKYFKNRISLQILWDTSQSIQNIHYYELEGCWCTICFLSAYVHRK